MAFHFLRCVVSMWVSAVLLSLYFIHIIYIFNKDFKPLKETQLPLFGILMCLNGKFTTNVTCKEIVLLSTSYLLPESTYDLESLS